LHDTHGFPIDLTRIMAEERGMGVDLAEYERLMEQARELARGVKRAAESSVYELPPAKLNAMQRSGLGSTNDVRKFDLAPIRAEIKDLWDGKNENMPFATADGRELAVILDQTNFYAEMGGQVGDRGELRSGEVIFDVSATRSSGGYVLHIGKLRSGRLTPGETVTATVLQDRINTEKNHTSTHLANWALREVLGEGVQQKGSLVDPDKLRFDFSHNKAMSDEELARVESLVNERIARKWSVNAETAPQEDALKINGLRAVFGEKYPPMVRVVSIGAPVKDLLADPANPKWREYSIEFCGGTHLGNTVQAEAFCIGAEESVSKGIRRIMAFTGDQARRAKEEEAVLDRLLAKAAELDDENLGASLAEIQKDLSDGHLPLLARRRAQLALNELQTRYRAWEKRKQAANKSAVDPVAAGGELLSKAEPLGPGQLIVGAVAGATARK
jgi:alanyl-tRNA synthetase